MAKKQVAGERKTEGKSAGSKKTSVAKQEITKPRAFPIIGMGGSAGSFKAFEKFFTHMPADCGMAFIIVIHLDPQHKARVADLIQNYTRMPVIEAENGILVEQGHVYIIPPHKDISIHYGKLVTVDFGESKNRHMTIDYFLQSLADDQWNNAVAIIFSGMGTDGETGLRMVKEKLGMAMVQDPDSAEYSSMPRSAINTGLADYVLPPEEMPLKLIQYLNHPVLNENARDLAISETKTNQVIQNILLQLRSSVGHDFSLYKKSTIRRRIDRRIAFNQLPDYVQYANFLKDNSQEIEILFNELLIGVTKFFRDKEAFEILQKKLLDLLSQKPADEPVRIWVAGCSTGEEAYSIAILVMECQEQINRKHQAKVQIFATDLDIKAIEHARQGIYYGNITADVSPERIERFFIRNNDGFSAKKELREMIVFAQHNLIKDAPFTRLDLLCCRNVMIYLTNDLQKKILPLFHYSLMPKGLMFMGPAETIGSFGSLFKTIDGKWKLFEKQEAVAGTGKMIDFPFNVSNPAGRLFKNETMQKSLKKNDLSDIFGKILIENYTPAALLINEKGDILYINGKPGKFLELSSGEGVMNIHRMAREELKYALGNAIRQVFIHKGQITLPEIKLTDGLQGRLVNVEVSYLEGTALNGLVIIVFNDLGLSKKPAPRLSKKNLSITDGQAEELQKELIYTKQQLQTTIEQMETSMEELKSTNEELQSTNEELQSTNEESLTTKEEMQSLNEELMTINMQYQVKAEELTQLNNDMKNLLDSTETGTIFLDNQLNILRFTPQIKKLFNVIPGDVGRSINHVVSNFNYPAVEQDIMEVIEKLTGKEIEVKTNKGEWYNLRIMPYRTLDNFISGAVLTFDRITFLKAMQTRLNILQKYTSTAIQQINEPAILLDNESLIVSVNSAFLTYFKLKENDIQKLSFNELLRHRWQTDKLDMFLKNSLHKNSSVSIVHDFPSIGLKKLVFSSDTFKDVETAEAYLMLLTLKEGKI
ncbi:CheR family methyltransferase [Mucilaginibacter pocheonensis]|uniref:Two-component system CheB/CheR fusion protein n=1 Tax=Mucilaginibacter pocheonensis TaxID=398050 RepID=A0ABU1TCQ6_9SPHI|nr:chemotaxis protein CheB [Mucilaginibacter pocheonensis]MDR6943176.1 two-component system CheB/CheR fusion protein [Mucilaginibacter pocheonensis]